MLSTDHPNTTCVYCGKMFCTLCGAKAGPIKAHGNQFHRKSCICYATYNDGRNERSEDCEECMAKAAGSCEQPKDLESGDIPTSEVPSNTFN